MKHIDYRKYPVKRVLVNIDMKKTGELISQAVKNSGYTVKEIMKITGVTTEQAVYKWFRGDSLPSLEAQYALCKLFGFQTTELIVYRETDDDPGETKEENAPQKKDEQKFTGLEQRLNAYWEVLKKMA